MNKRRTKKMTPITEQVDPIEEAAREEEDPTPLSLYEIRAALDREFLRSLTEEDINRIFRDAIEDTSIPSLPPKKRK